MGVVVAEEAAVVVPSEVQTSQARFQRLASFTCLDTASCVCVSVEAFCIGQRRINVRGFGAVLRAYWPGVHADFLLNPEHRIRQRFWF